ncbi:MAG: MoaD/ThiS family protein [Candidatus Methylomirabilales bacterium]
MTIRVSFMGVMRTVTRETDVGLSAAPGVTLREVLDSLERRYGPEFGRRVFRSQVPPRPLQMHTRIFVNGNLTDEEKLDEPLPVDGGEAGCPEVLIYLMPAATGG